MDGAMHSRDRLSYWDMDVSANMAGFLRAGCSIGMGETIGEEGLSLPDGGIHPGRRFSLEWRILGDTSANTTGFIRIGCSIGMGEISGRKIYRCWMGESIGKVLLCWDAFIKMADLSGQDVPAGGEIYRRWIVCGSLSIRGAFFVGMASLREYFH